MVARDIDCCISDFSQLLTGNLFTGWMQLQYIVDDLSDYRGQVLDFVHIKNDFKFAIQPILCALDDILPIHLFTKNSEVNRIQCLLQKHVGSLYHMLVSNENYNAPKMPVMGLQLDRPELVQLLCVLEPIENDLVRLMLEPYLILLSPLKGDYSAKTLAEMYKRHVICAKTGQICIYRPDRDMVCVVKVCPPSSGIVSDAEFSDNLERLRNARTEYAKITEHLKVEMKNRLAAHEDLVKHVLYTSKLNSKLNDVLVLMDRTNLLIEAMQQSIYYKKRQIEQLKQEMKTYVVMLNECTRALNEIQVHI